MLRLHSFRALLLLSATLFACSGDRGPTGPAGPAGTPGDDGPPGDDGTDATSGDDGTPTRTDLSRYESLPGVVLDITKVETTLGEAPDVGSTLKVTFTVKKKDGKALPLAELDYGGVFVSGPTDHYQMVVLPLRDLVSKSVANADGSYSYTFAAPLPATYPPPLNDTDAFGLADGELKGLSLQGGTYTVGIEAYKNYYIEGDTYRDAGGAHEDFLLGAATVITPRAVTQAENCNSCHREVRAHGTFRRDLGNCVLCHTAGSEDRNTPDVAEGTPGISIEFGVMIHRIHNGSHLPSVLGVTTDESGARNYAAAAKPYEIMGYGNAIIDFSHVVFPVFPNFNIVMPRDSGYDLLAAGNKTKEDNMRRGATDCAKCHGDPDGAGPVLAPAQGELAMTKPTARACGSCHDDIAWNHAYTANGYTMPAQASDDDCDVCHQADSSLLPTRKAHLHPLWDTAINPGLKLAISSLAEAGTNNGDGNIDVGEKVSISFTLTDDAGAPVSPTLLPSLNYVLSGPTTNYNLVMYTGVPTFALTGSQPYTVLLPEPVYYEYSSAFVSTDSLDVFTTARAPHWNAPTGAPVTAVLVRTATSSGTTLSGAAVAGQNYVDVASIPAGLAANDYVVLDDDTINEEYRRVGKIEGTRVFFTTPASYAQLSGLRKAHASGVSFKEVTLTAKASPADFTVNNGTGAITEVTEFGNGAKIVVSYTTDFVVPAKYPTAPFDSPDIDDAFGEWANQPLSEGTYTVTLWGYRQLCVNSRREPVALTAGACTGTDVTSYRGTSPSATKDFLLGVTPGSLTAYANISGAGATCNNCHNDVFFHGGGRRGFETCIACHGVAGSELSIGEAGEPSTVKFAQYLHKAHKALPSMVGGAKDCTMCHGTATNWKSPPPQIHSNPDVAALIAPTRTYSFACVGCHDTPSAQGHFDSNTAPSGQEACATCHNSGKLFAIEVMHKSW